MSNVPTGIWVRSASGGAGAGAGGGVERMLSGAAGGGESGVESVGCEEMHLVSVPLPSSCQSSESPWNFLSDQGVSCDR